MGLREIKIKLKKLDNEALIMLISEFYKKYEPVKEFLDFYTNPNEEKIISNYKRKIKEGFYPKRGYKLELSISRKAINEFKKLNTSKKSLVDLLLYFVECGVELTNEFGDIDENFYTSIENTFKIALKLMEDENILLLFKDRAFGVVTNTKDIGWGFHDYLGDLYYEYYE